MHQNYIKYNTKTASKSTHDCSPLLCYRFVSTALTAQIPNGNAIANLLGLLHTGKERDSETGFSYFGARYYDSDILTGWLSVDPMADKYPNISPYAYCAWNPVRLVDPDAKEIWLPEITENGDISYVAEKGDTKETFRQQYNVSKEATEAIFKNAGIDEVSEDTRISGDIIAKSVTNNTNRRYNDVLKLNWRGSTDKQKVYYTMFALLCSNQRSGESIVDMNQFFSNMPSTTGDHSCFKVTGSLKIPLLNGETMPIKFFNSSFNKQFSTVRAQPPKNLHNGNHNHRFDQHPGNIQRILISFPSKYNKQYSNIYY